MQYINGYIGQLLAISVALGRAQYWVKASSATVSLSNSSILSGVMSASLGRPITENLPIYLLHGMFSHQSHEFTKNCLTNLASLTANVSKWRLVITHRRKNVRLYNKLAYRCWPCITSIFALQRIDAKLYMLRHMASLLKNVITIEDQDARNLEIGRFIKKHRAGHV